MAKHTRCRTYLKTMREKARKRLPIEEIQQAKIKRIGREIEFEIPGKFSLKNHLDDFPFEISPLCSCLWFVEAFSWGIYLKKIMKCGICEDEKYIILPGKRIPCPDCNPKEFLEWKKARGKRNEG